jgi:hypothetical protein
MMQDNILNRKENILQSGFMTWAFFHDYPKI